MMFDSLGPYQLVRKLGRGGMGVVYEGVDVETGQRAALKVLSGELSEEEGFRQRFEAEIEALRHLKHPNIVRLFGFGQREGILFYAMELVEGPSLEAELRRGRRFSWQEAVRMGIQICRGLRHAHDRGIVHRDLKPGNLLLAPDGVVKLSDFGIAQLFGRNRVTAVGSVVGTIEYMAPEQARGGPVDARADLYSLGGVLYAMLSGHPPLRARTLTEMLEKIYSTSPEPLRRSAPDIPEALDQLLEQLLEKNPSERIATAFIAARRLEALLQAAEENPRSNTPPADLDQEDRLEGVEATGQNPRLNAPEDVAPPEAAQSGRSPQSVAVPLSPSAGAEGVSPPPDAPSVDSESPAAADVPNEPCDQAAKRPDVSKPDGADQRTEIHHPQGQAEFPQEGSLSEQAEPGRELPETKPMTLPPTPGPAEDDVSVQLPGVEPRGRPSVGDWAPTESATPGEVKFLASPGEPGADLASPPPISPRRGAALPGPRTESESARPTHFTPVSEEELDRGPAEESSPPWISWQTWFLAAALLAVGMTVWYLLQPPSADTLYRRIDRAGQEGTIEALRHVESAIQDFLSRYPGDPRAEQIRQLERELDLDRLERRFELQASGRLRTAVFLSPWEQAYAEAVALARTNPDLGVAKLQALLDLYENRTDRSGPVGACLELARRRLERLRQQSQERAAGALKVVEERLRRADELEKSSPAAARAIRQAVVELYADKPWAASAVARAKAALASAPPETAPEPPGPPPVPPETPSAPSDPAPAPSAPASGLSEAAPSSRQETSSPPQGAPRATPPAEPRPDSSGSSPSSKNSSERK